MEEITDARFAVQEHLTYRDAWAVNSRHLAKQSCYRWMAAQIADFAPRRILDIGCGTGEGILALLKAFPAEIVSLEENPLCIDAALAAVLQAGHQAETQERIGYVTHADGTHDLGMDMALAVEAKAPVTFVHTDLLVPDEPLQRWFDHAPAFDAVTMWLMGTCKIRANCRALKVHGLTTSEEYRLLVETFAFDLADKVLRPGGVLQIVLRGQAITSPEMADMITGDFKVRAETTSLQVQAPTHRKYDEAKNKGMRVLFVKDGIYSPLSTAPSSLHSIVAAKPGG